MSTPLGTVDPTAALRNLTTSILLAAETHAGDRVQRERVDPVQPEDMPMLLVRVDDNQTLISNAGTLPRFETSATLTVDCITDAPAIADCVDQIDVLVYEVKNALLTNQVWLASFSRVEAMSTQRSFTQDRTVIGTAKVIFRIAFMETWSGTVGAPLRTVGLTFSPAGAADLLTADIPIPQ